MGRSGMEISVQSLFIEVLFLNFLGSSCIELPFEGLGFVRGFSFPLAGRLSHTQL